MNGNTPDNIYNSSTKCNTLIETKEKENEETETREITQTDHLNRKLLESFLTRLNSTDLACLVDRANIQDEPSQDFEENDEMEQDVSSNVEKFTENKQVKDWNLCSNRNAVAVKNFSVLY